MNFDNFKSNISHDIKNIGDYEYIKHLIDSSIINDYFNRKQYKEAFYLVATLDYLSRINNIPLCKKFDNIRKLKLKETLFPSSIIIIDYYMPEKNIKQLAIKESLPEFLHFNIVEKDVKNCA